MSLIATTDRYWQTVRHLRPGQILGRIYFRNTRPAPDLTPAASTRPGAGLWQPPTQHAPSLVGPDEFCFLNTKGRLQEHGWDDPQTEKLWRYNQHYFDDLNALDGPDRGPWHRALLRDWLARNPPSKGTGWEPYPTSLRIVNWIKWALAGNDLPQEARHSLAVQARWLARRLERHLLGNHLFANAKALIFAGVWFEGAEAQEWLTTGFGVLEHQVPEQILPDGGQFELSPMYHALALEDLLDLINIAHCHSAALGPRQQKQQQDWQARVPAMLHWLHALCHPDGGLAFFNDAAFGIAPTVADLGSYAARLGMQAEKPGTPLIWLSDSGYGRLSLSEAVLMVDMARVGPDYLPGHAHADSLSFEFSLHGQRLIVNSGTSVYGTGPERQRQRGTAAHSTVTVSGRDSSEIWGGFRVARRAKMVATKMHLEGETRVAEGSHDGYCRLSGRPVHHRRWQLSPGALVIADSLSDDRHPAEARFHLHPAIEASQTAPDYGTCRLSDGQCVAWQSKAGEARLEPSTWHPEFGLSLPSICIVLPLVDGQARLELTWG